MEPRGAQGRTRSAHRLLLWHHLCSTISDSRDFIPQCPPPLDRHAQGGFVGADCERRGGGHVGRGPEEPVQGGGTVQRQPAAARGGQRAGAVDIQRRGGAAQRPALRALRGRGAGVRVPLRAAPGAAAPTRPPHPSHPPITSHPHQQTQLRQHPRVPRPWHAVQWGQLTHPHHPHHPPHLAHPGGGGLSPLPQGAVSPSEEPGLSCCRGRGRR
mmetsp:Transcript_15142/g.34051  ORF Transcript_15142/g.34051 Transcript_15142/m.34051 type:complete len:213 (-) Transcript_15142:57-695(-)